MRITRLLTGPAVLTVVAVSVLGAGLASSTPASASAASAPIISAASGPWFELELAANNHTLCLDARDAGPGAGQNGDKVQIWKCSGTPNQYWRLSPNPGPGTYFYRLINEEYPAECLNATLSLSLQSTSKAQLWGCGGESNDEWTTRGGVLFSQYYLSYSLALQAETPYIGNGDQVQVGPYTGAANQIWNAANYR
jgi:Ricin-type beta-trefoil lectin domain